jgi:hypothetical protein
VEVNIYIYILGLEIDVHSIGVLWGRQYLSVGFEKLLWGCPRVAVPYPYPIMRPLKKLVRGALAFGMSNNVGR